MDLRQFSSVLNPLIFIIVLPLNLPLDIFNFQIKTSGVKLPSFLHHLINLFFSFLCPIILLHIFTEIFGVFGFPIFKEIIIIAGEKYHMVMGNNNKLISNNSLRICCLFISLSPRCIVCAVSF